MKTLRTLLAGAAVAAISAGAAQAEKWDMPMAYADSNFHTQNGKAFAEQVFQREITRPIGIGAGTDHRNGTGTRQNAGNVCVGVGVVVHARHRGSLQFQFILLVAE